MAKNYCTFIPSKGKTLFKELKKQFGYQTARSIFLRAINPQFISDYKNTLSLDAEGVPTYESLMANPFMKSFIGDKRMAEGLNRAYTPIEDTRDNYGNLLESAYQFNTTNAQRDNFLATVEYVGEGKIGVVIQPKTPEASNRFQEQYAVQKLNERLASIFQPLGVTIGTLSQAETNAGRVGLTDFSVARDIANGFASMIKVANNMEGATALTEEFSHLIIGVFRNSPLVDRAVNSLMGHEDAIKEILGDNYDDVVNFYGGDMALVAEEAVGHILQKNLLHDSQKLPNQTLFRRMIDWIVKQFQAFKISDVQNVIDQVDSLTSSLARDILNGTRQITQEDIKASQREAQFNALSDRINRNIEILRGAAKTETKRFKISKSEGKKDAAEILVNSILDYTSDTADTVEGLFNYAKHALGELRNLEAQFQMADSMTPEQKFGFLRNARMYIQSYGSFIQALNDAIIEEGAEDDNLFLRDFDVNGEQVSIQNVVKELNSLSEQLARRYSKVAMPAFAEFLKPFLGEEIIVPFGKYAGTKMSVESLLTEAQSDISFMDRWLDSMADSSDVILQAYDAAVKRAKDTARLQTLDYIRQIQAFRDKAESLGITEFDWMFEKDDKGQKSGNYISEINYGQFQKDLKEFEEYLENKYGKNPSGDEAVYKMVERNDWLKTHSMTVFGTPQPNPTMYRNSAYDRLTSNQQTVLTEFLALKSIFDEKLPKSRVARNKAIQMRKAGNQRFWESITSPSTLFDNIKESVSATFLDREDDDQIFGNARAERGLTDFAGNEFMTLPVLFTTRLENPDELTDDVVGSLMSYAYMATKYEQMDKIIDPLEVGFTLLTEDRKVRKTRGDKQLVEKFNALDIDIASKIFTSESNIKQKLNDFRESQIYERYLKDEGTFFDTNVSVTKVTSFILKGSSLAQLGFNWLANLANVATGLGMQNIEAAAGQFFGPKELAKADWEYKNHILPMMAEIGSRTKTNKLSLFFELFDIRQNFNSNLKRVQKKNLLQRLFGAEIAFLGQDAGDHWLYGRAAIAMAMREKVRVDGKEMSLWDALQVEDVNGNSSIKQLNYKNITDLDGNPFDVAKFSRKVAHINQRSFGIYNDDDANAANRVAVGRLLQQYRKWWKIQMNTRFQAGQKNLATDTWEEGYYRTVGRMLNQWIRGGVQLNEQWDTMTEEEKANVKRAITEVVQFFAVWALANWVEWPDDKKRPWALKLAEYSSKRLAHELGGLTPTPVMLQENLKTFKSPLPSLTTIQNGLNVILSAVDPADWTDEISSGPYKGLSTLEKNIIKSPIPGVAQYRQIDKFVRDLDNSINYYARPAQ